MIYRGIDYGDITKLTTEELMAIASYEPDEVYFIRCGQYVKIGYSKQPPTRLKQIRRNVGGALTPPQLNFPAAELVATEPGGFDREHELHEQFANLRHTGEWFTEAPELTDYINELRSAAA